MTKAKLPRNDANAPNLQFTKSLKYQSMNYEHFTHPEKKKDIYLVDMTREKGYFSELMTKAITKNLTEKKKILIIVNKK